MRNHGWNRLNVQESDTNPYTIDITQEPQLKYSMIQLKQAGWTLLLDLAINGCLRDI